MGSGEKLWEYVVVKGVEGGINKVGVHRWAKVDECGREGAQDAVLVLVGVADRLPIT